MLDDNALPPLYRPWIEALLGAPLRAEPQATCHDCAMVARPDRAPPPVAFHPQVKCCTYQPGLPNFLVGRILAGEESPARRLIEERLAQRVAVTPYGIEPPAEYRLIYDDAIRRPGVFGRVPRLRCPFYVEAGGGQCGIWQARNATCATWFCKHEHGARGKLFWELLRRLLRLVERKLTLHAVMQLPLGDDCFAYLMSVDPAQRPIDEHDLNRTVNAQMYRVLWGNYVGQERRFFVECAELVTALTWSRVQAIGGAEVAMAARLVRQFHERLTQWPERVVRGAVAGQLARAGVMRVSAQPASYDTIDVPLTAVSLLPRLEGRPLRAALQELADEGHALDAQLVQGLLDFQILVSAD